MELAEPKPLVTPRRAVVLFVSLLLGLMAFGSLARVVSGLRASNECMADRPGVRLGWSEQRVTLFPPGVECVYLNRQGEVVGRNRYP